MASSRRGYIARRVGSGGATSRVTARLPLHWQALLMKIVLAALLVTVTSGTASPRRTSARSPHSASAATSPWLACGWPRSAAWRWTGPAPSARPGQRLLDELLGVSGGPGRPAGHGITLWSVARVSAAPLSAVPPGRRWKPTLFSLTSGTGKPRTDPGSPERGDDRGAPRGKSRAQRLRLTSQEPPHEHAGEAEHRVHPQRQRRLG